jgi:hypothetical protein
MVKGAFPNHGLVYPKADEKQPFMTRAEIERRIASGGLTPKQTAELWNCLFLTLPEIAELLDFVRGTAGHAWIYPIVAFAAHTGVRLSEAIRAMVADVDFDAATVMIREKKQVKGKRTTRHVPLSPFLAGLLREYLKGHPGGPLLFAVSEEVERSSKRSRTTVTVRARIKRKKEEVIEESPLSVPRINPPEPIVPVIAPPEPVKPINGHAKAVMNRPQERSEQMRLFSLRHDSEPAGVECENHIEVRGGHMGNQRSAVIATEKEIKSVIAAVNFDHQVAAKFEFRRF